MKQKKIQGLKIYYRDNTSDEAVIDHSFNNDIFYIAMPELLKVKDMVVVDVGAHIGTFSLYSSLLFPEGKIVAIEASESNYSILKKNIEDNKLFNIHPYHNALSDQSSKIKLFHDDENWGHSITHDFSNDYEIVDGISLQDVFDKEGLSKIDLMKFNCEGAEFQIIRTLGEHLAGKIGMMLILYHEDMVMNNSHSLDDLLKTIELYGYSYRIRNAKNKRGWIIAKNRKVYGWKSEMLFFYLTLMKRVKKFLTYKTNL